MELQEERVSLELMDEVWPLLEEHAKELNIYKCPLEPNVPMYLKAGNSGALAVYIMRDNGKLIGYAAYWICRHPHYNIQVASQDVIYLDMAYRKGRSGIKLIKFSEKKLKEDYKVDVIVQQSKVNKSLDKLFEYMEYDHIESVYAKVVSNREI